MSLSPSPVVVRPDPKLWGTRYPAPQRDGHKAAVLDHAKRAGHPCVPYDREGEDTATPLVMLPMVTTLEASLIVTALRGSAFGACHELGERLAADLRARPVAVDVCPPNGIPRPGGVA